MIVGLRPEDIEDAAFAPSANGSSLDVNVALAESMGAEVIAHFPVAGAADHRRVDARRARRSRRAGGRLGPDAARCGCERRGAGHGPAQPAQPRPRPASRFASSLDAERLHFFDPETEASIW